MKFYNGQGEFFNGNDLDEESTPTNEALSLSSKCIKEWKERIHFHQISCFRNTDLIDNQINLFKEESLELTNNFQPLKLTPLPLNFWRWSKPYHQGPAIYVVMDSFDNDSKAIILYIGETIAAEQRWKGEHDCKAYLDNYCAAIHQAKLTTNLNIRFWTDVPTETKKRRKLEQRLIQKWLPPFNKETRARWQTPFTNEIN